MQIKSQLLRTQTLTGSITMTVVTTVIRMIFIIIVIIITGVLNITISACSLLRSHRLAHDTQHTWVIDGYTVRTHHVLLE